MPTPDVTGGARVAFKFSQHGEERVNVLHVTKSTDWTQTELASLGSQMVNAWHDVWRTYCPDDICLIEVIATSLEGGDSEQAVVGCATECCGTQTTSPAPGNATSTISWRTTGIGRRKRGRTYPPGMLDNQINDDDTIGSGHLVELLQVAFALMAAASGIGGSQLGVFSRVANTISVVFSAIVENVLDHQDRRLPKRGR